MPICFLRFELLVDWTVCYIIKLPDKLLEGAEKLKTEKKWIYLKI